MSDSPEPAAHTNKKQIGNYSFGRTLGQGTFGKVKLATHKPTDQPVAIKILEKDKIVDVADVERVSREIHILKLIRHPNIIQLYEIIETPRYLFLVMEFVEGGQLFDYIVKCKRLRQQEACKLYHQLINGIEYIHRLNIVHRDLKPENLLLDFDRSLKVVDFGLSNTYKPGETLKTPCGSPCYAAPEMIKAEKYQGLRVDVWSSGVILFAMLCGYLPFEDADTGNLYKKILSGKYSASKSLSEDAKNMISRVLELDPEKRATIEQIREHPWMKQNADVPNNQGIIIGYNRIPVDATVLKKLTSKGYDAQYVTKCVEANRHNDATTAYYLTMKQYLKEGGSSAYDMSSKAFDHSLIQPIKRPQPEQSKAANLLFQDLLEGNKQNKQPSRTYGGSRQPSNEKHPATGEIDIDVKEIKHRRQSKVQSTRLADESARKSVGKYYIPTANLSVARGRSRELNTPGNRINKKYREEFNRSLVSRSMQRPAADRSLKKHERKRMTSHVNQELVNTLNSMSRDRGNFRSELCDLSSKLTANEDLLASYTVNQPGTTNKHKRGRSSQGSVQRKTDIMTTSINESIMNISKQLRMAAQQPAGTRRPKILQ